MFVHILSSATIFFFYYELRFFQGVSYDYYISQKKTADMFGLALGLVVVKQPNQAQLMRDDIPDPRVRIGPPH